MTIAGEPDAPTLTRQESIADRWAPAPGSLLDLRAIANLVSSSTAEFDPATDDFSPLPRLTSIAEVLQPFVNGVALDFAESYPETVASDQIAAMEQQPISVSRNEPGDQRLDASVAASPALVGGTNATRPWFEEQNLERFVPDVRDTIPAPGSSPLFGDPASYADTAKDIVSSFVGSCLDPFDQFGDTLDQWPQVDLSRPAEISPLGPRGDAPELPPGDPGGFWDTGHRTRVDPVGLRQATIDAVLANLLAEGQTLVEPGSLFPLTEHDLGRPILAGDGRLTLQLSNPLGSGWERRLAPIQALATTSAPTEPQAGTAEQPLATLAGASALETQSIAELVSRLLLAVDRLEQVADRLAAQVPRLPASAPRPFLGRVSG